MLDVAGNNRSETNAENQETTTATATTANNNNALRVRLIQTCGELRIARQKASHAKKLTHQISELHKQLFDVSDAYDKLQEEHQAAQAQLFDQAKSFKRL